jgi:hypothetical protein
MVEPVVTSDGHVYERKAISHWLEDHNKSPLTGLPLKCKALIPVHTITQRNREFDPKAFEEHDKERAAAAAAAKAKAEQNQKEVTLILSCGDAADLMSETKMIEVFDALQWNELKCAQLFTSGSTLDRDSIIADPELCEAFLEFWGIALKRSLCLFYHCRYRWHTTSTRMEKMLDTALEYWELNLKSDCHIYKLILLGNMEFLVPVTKAVHAKLVYGLVHGCIDGYVDNKLNAYSMKLAENDTNVLCVNSGRLNEGGADIPMDSRMYVVQTTSPYVPNAETTIFSLTGRTVCGNQIKQVVNDTTPQQLTEKLGRSLQVATMFKNCTPPVLTEEMFDLHSIDALNILSLKHSKTLDRASGYADKRGTLTLELVEWEKEELVD